MPLLRIATVVISAVLWGWSFSLPAIVFRLSTDNGRHNMPFETETYSGMGMFFASILGPCFLNFAGVANILLLVGLILLLRNRPRGARINLGIAALLTLQTFQMRLIEFPFDEAGVRNGLLLHPLVGWYVWAGSILLPLAVAFLLPSLSPVFMAPAATAGGQVSS
ncbi:hypothetical protein [Terriglobus sp.]|uniref:hypothetical protein n=1 Tax=Terriglobus sp. TaxID=1889013 RepID=UPI003AFFA832